MISHVVLISNLVIATYPTICCSLTSFHFVSLYSVHLVVPHLHLRPRAGRAERDLRSDCRPVCPVQLWSGQLGVGTIVDLPSFSDLFYQILLLTPSLDPRCRLFCVPAPLADGTCSSMQCGNSSMLLGNFTLVMTGAGCSVTSCGYGGYANGTILTT